MQTERTLSTTPAAGIPQSATAVKKSTRLQSIDLVRGFALIAMLISHSIGVVPGLRYAAAYDRNAGSPPRLTSIENLFGLVWHFATPAFMLLAGIGLALFIAGRVKRGWDDAQITRYLLIRGAALIALDVLIGGWSMSPVLHFKIGFSILSCTGTCIWVIALVRKLDTRFILALMLVVLLVTQTIYTYGGPTPDAPNLYAFLIGGSSETLQVFFPILGWLPIVLLGFVIGSNVTAGKLKLREFSRKMSIIMFALWIIISAFDSFGKMYPGSPLFFTKHPPGLDFLTFYLGWTFLLLSVLENGRDWTQNRLLRLVTLFGQTSLFFYVLHEDFVLNGFQLLLGRLSFVESLPHLPLSFAVSFAALAILVMLCRWYRDLKRRHPESVLQYF